MFVLTLLWLLVGALMSGLALVAQFHHPVWTSFGWARLLVIGMGTALCGGWAALVFLGSPFSIPAALWISILGLLLLPRCWQSLEKRLRM